ncbi:SDR family NAD(P)-dependent oxidoreductase [Sphingomonas morindae]|uniref:Glucose 1-dehydrogenase n=1 Tax=Sphingomonas morindae TaxID=1541170 RepID=A0ABY4X9E5_9SPHN|nr:glucose 1-dehydrogenase [Sphingomonas morindae]USI73503.1 glucose 1-dehydrogenase [Sphingomonas morindae]
MSHLAEVPFWKAINMGDELRGKVALVTGAGRGIGRAIALRLAAAGAHVSVTYHVSGAEAAALVEKIQGHGVRAMAIKADMGKVSEVVAATEQTYDMFGRLDILVNNAGILAAGLMEDVSIERFDEAYAVNVRGPFAAIQAAAPRMERGGRIINIGSIGSDFMPYKGRAAYTMSKGALASLTRGLARELGERGITINNVQPGRVLTRLLKEASDDKLSEFASSTAVGRLGEPDEVADLVAYLARSQAGYITGANLRIDGGTSA